MPQVQNNNDYGAEAPMVMAERKDKLAEILNKLVQGPELRKYPYSYNPIIIERTASAIRTYLMAVL